VRLHAAAAAAAAAGAVKQDYEVVTERGVKFTPGTWHLYGVHSPGVLLAANV
jgi:hypothetical protein